MKSQIITYFPLLLALFIPGAIQNTQAQGLLAYWPLDEVSGTTTPDASGNGMDMDLNFMDATNLIPGQFGMAMEFDGAEELLTRVHQPEDPLPISQYEAHTIALWVKGDYASQVGGGDRRVFSEGSDSNNDPLLNIGTHNAANDATVDIYLRNGGGPPHQHSILEAFDDEWHHITYVRDGDELKIYVDGQLDETLWTFHDPYASGVTNNTSIGGILRAAPSHWFTGAIDEVAVFDTALSEEEVAGLVDGSLLSGEDPDADGDGLPDAWEERNNVDDPNGDPDGDNLTNLEEFEKGTDPNEADSDMDGLNDDVETATGEWVSSENTGTDPRNSDSDDDGLLDGVETNTGAFVDQENTGTSPLIGDTDEDDFSDSFEISQDTDPTDPNSFPQSAGLLVAYWPLDEIVGGNMTPDLSGNDYHLELNNMDEDNLVAGKIGNAMEFDSGTETLLSRIHTEGEDLPITQFDSYTISIWANVEGTGQNDLRIFSEASTSNANPIFNLGTHNGGADATLDFFIRNGGSNGHEHSIGDAFDGTWRHIAWVFQDGMHSLYIDGVLDGQTWNNTFDLRGRLDTTTVGGILRATPSHWVTGTLDEVCLWQNALGTDEIESLAAGDPHGGSGVIFQITEIEMGENNSSATITWNSKSSRTYAVEQSRDLDQWVELTDGHPSGGETTSFEIDGLEENFGYFRVREEN